MAELIPNSPIWLMITHLGAAGNVLPLLLIGALALWQCEQRKALRHWLLAFGLAALLTLSSKMLFLGWGIGIAAINFTGISGHTLLSTSILPLLCAWLWAPLRTPFNPWGAFCGLLLGVLVAFSLVVIGAHSASEVLLGWLAGSLVSLAALRALGAPKKKPLLASLAAVMLVLGWVGNFASYLPTHDWEIRLALLFSARDKPYTRDQLHGAATLRPAQVALGAKYSSIRRATSAG